MTDAEQYLLSRRAFMKNAVVGAAASLMIGIDDDAAQARSESSSLTNLSLSEVSQLVRTKKVSPVEVTKECLSRIERLNPKLNAFITAPGKPFNSRGPSSPRGNADLLHRGPFLQVVLGQGPVAPLAISIGDVAAIGV